MDVPPDESTGWAISRTRLVEGANQEKENQEENENEDKSVYVFVTYCMPNISARIVPLMLEFVEQCLKTTTTTTTTTTRARA